MNVTQYPHFLFVKEVQESVKDANGDWIQGGDEWVFHSVCREETNGKGSMIQLTDGRMITFASLIQCPKGTKAVKEGAMVMVCNNKDRSAVRISSKCMKSSVDQLHTRIWV